MADTPSENKGKGKLLDVRDLDDEKYEKLLSIIEEYGGVPEGLNFVEGQRETLQAHYDANHQFDDATRPDLTEYEKQNDIRKDEGDPAGLNRMADPHRAAGGPMMGTRKPGVNDVDGPGASMPEHSVLSALATMAEGTGRRDDALMATGHAGQKDRDAYGEAANMGLVGASGAGFSVPMRAAVETAGAAGAPLEMSDVSAYRADPNNQSIAGDVLGGVASPLPAMGARTAAAALTKAGNAMRATPAASGMVPQAGNLLERLGQVGGNIAPAAAPELGMMGAARNAVGGAVAGAGERLGAAAAGASKSIEALAAANPTSAGGMLAKSAAATGANVAQHAPGIAADAAAAGMQNAMLDGPISVEDEMGTAAGVSAIVRAIPLLGGIAARQVGNTLNEMSRGKGTPIRADVMRSDRWLSPEVSDTIMSRGQQIKAQTDEAMLTMRSFSNAARSGDQTAMRAVKEARAKLSDLKRQSISLDNEARLAEAKSMADKLMGKNRREAKEVAEELQRNTGALDVMTLNQFNEGLGRVNDGLVAVGLADQSKLLNKMFTNLKSTDPTTFVKDAELITHLESVNDAMRRANIRGDLSALEVAYEASQELERLVDLYASVRRSRAIAHQVKTVVNEAPVSDQFNPVGRFFVERTQQASEGQFERLLRDIHRRGSGNNKWAESMQGMLDRGSQGEASGRSALSSAARNTFSNPNDSGRVSALVQDAQVTGRSLWDKEEDK